MVSLLESGTIKRIPQELAASLILGDSFLWVNVHLFWMTNSAYLLYFDSHGASQPWNSQGMPRKSTPEPKPELSILLLAKGLFWVPLNIIALT